MLALLLLSRENRPRDQPHPSERAYEAMAHAAANKIIRSMPRYDHEEYL